MFYCSKQSPFGIYYGHANFGHLNLNLYGSTLLGAVIPPRNSELFLKYLRNKLKPKSNECSAYYAHREHFFDIFEASIEIRKSEKLNQRINVLRI